MRTAFKPLGEQSRREMALDHLSTHPEGAVVTYDELADAIGTQDRQIVQAAVNDAKAALERNHSKAVVAIRNTGYRIVHANEHLGLAAQHQLRSRRQLRKSRSKVTYVDYTKLTEGERAAVTLAATSIGMQIEYMRRNDIRAERIEAAVEVVQTASQRSDQEIAELRRRLDLLENRT